MREVGFIKHIIVGVDPGTTVGIAVLDLEGNIIEVESGKNLSVADVIFEIQSFGEPLVIATDRNPAPKSVKKVKAAFKCLLFEPEEHLSVAEKKELLRNIDPELKKKMNNHEKDALAAALKAFNHFSAKIRNLRKRYGHEEKIAKAMLKKRK